MLWTEQVEPPVADDGPPDREADVVVVGAGYAGPRGRPGAGRGRAVGHRAREGAARLGRPRPQRRDGHPRAEGGSPHAPHEVRRARRPDVPRGERGVRPRRGAHRRRDRLRLRPHRPAVPRARRAPGRRTCASSPRSTRRKARTSSSSTATSSPARSARPRSTARCATPAPAGCTPPASTPAWPASLSAPAHGCTTAARRRASSRPRGGFRVSDPAWRGQRPGRDRRDERLRRRPAPGAAPAGAADRQLHRHDRTARRRRARRGQPTAPHVRRHQEPPLLLAHHARRPRAVRRSAQPRPRIARRSPRVPDRLDCSASTRSCGARRSPTSGRATSPSPSTACPTRAAAGRVVRDGLQRLGRRHQHLARPPDRPGGARRGRAAGGGRSSPPRRSRCTGPVGPTCPPSGAWFRWQDRS